MQTSETNCGKCNKFIPVRSMIIKCDTCEHFFMSSVVMLMRC